MLPPYDLITILGPTASGKTRLAACLAARLGDTEIISADSRQLYRGMDLGTGKDLADYVVDGRSIPYHLIDVAPAGARWNLFQYREAFRQAYAHIRQRGKRAILCGGTGLYIEALIKGYQMVDVPQNHELRARLADVPLAELAHILAQYGPLHNTTDTADRAHALRAIEIHEHYRLHPPTTAPDMPQHSLVIGTHVDRDTRRARITQRLHARLEEGMIDEVRHLLQTIAPADLIYYGLEYKYLTLYCTGQLSRPEMERQLEIAIHQFAKRQMTWFRGMERRGTPIHWIDTSRPMHQMLDEIVSLL